jgi:hypothetical protein
MHAVDVSRHRVGDMLELPASEARRQTDGNGTTGAAGDDDVRRGS